MPRSRRCDLSPQSEAIKRHELIYCSTDELADQYEAEDWQQGQWQDPSDNECRVHGRLATTRAGDE